MIVVLSRFRVANGMSDAVRSAFLQRPHLVDAAEGFLGLETFRDARDRSIFYLLTRWSDFDCFQQWHGSDAHRTSHRGIPKGLKLDPAFTQVYYLEDLLHGTDDERAGR